MLLNEESKNEVSKIVFLDVNAAFRKRNADRISYLWGSSHDFDDFVERASKNAKDRYSGYDYERIRRRVYDGSFETGYYMFVTEIMNAWSEEAVMRFAEVLRACGAKFVLSSPFRDCFGRGAIASLFSYFPIDDVFLDMTVTPDPLFRRQVMRRTDEGPAPADYLPRYRRMMRELWHRIDEEAGGGVCHRAVEIREYLDRHRELSSYAVIDAHPAMAGIPADRQLSCADVFSEEDAVRLRTLLDAPAEIPRLPERCRGPELDLFRETCVLSLYRRWRDPAISGMRHGDRED